MNFENRNDPAPTKTIDVPNISLFLIYNFVLRKKMPELGFVTLSSHIAALAIKIPIVLLSGFLLQKYVTFSSSSLNGKVQLFRYSIVFFANLCICYFGMKLLVDGFNIYPSPSNIIISIVTVFISYFSQKLYTFKTSNTELLQELLVSPLTTQS